MQYFVHSNSYCRDTQRGSILANLKANTTKNYCPYKSKGETQASATSIIILLALWLMDWLCILRLTNLRNWRWSPGVDPICTCKEVANYTQM